MMASVLLCIFGESFWYYSRLSISFKSKGLSEILLDICTLINQICRIEVKINRTSTVNKQICNLTPEVRDIRTWKILRKRGEIFSTLFYCC